MKGNRAVVSKTSEVIARKVLDYKLALSMTRESSYPVMTSFKEDLELRNISWIEKFGTIRIMMLDLTNFN